MNKVKISVCIPVYNCEEFIGEAIDSVLKQTFTDYELIILDNQSTDRTVQIIKQYTDPRIKFFQNDTNIGMLGNWNKILTYTNGEYIKMLPADDYLSVNCLASQSKILDNDTQKKIALVSGRKNIVDSKGKIYFNRGLTNSDMQMSGFDAINKTVRSGGNTLGEPGSVMFRKDILAKAGSFDDGIYYVMDVNMWFKMLLHGDLYFLKEVVCSFRVSGVSESIKLIDTQKRDVNAFFTKIYLDKSYKLSWFNYKVGLFNSFVSAVLKKLVYKFALK
jgi:glycosyltransferase involved in cell wall biosynthesis